MRADTLWPRFTASTERDGGKTAITQGDRHWTFLQLYHTATGYGAQLQALGIVPGKRVLVCAPNSPQVAAAMLACWATGAIPVLLHPASPQHHIEHALATTGALVSFIEPGSSVLPGSYTGEVIEVSQEPGARAVTGFRSERILRSDPASIVFTSGSTGLPKGVTQSHATLTDSCDNVFQYLGLLVTDRIVCPIPWSFDYGYGQLLTTICHGLTQILPVVDNPFGVCEAITRHRPTVFPGLPSWYTYLFGGVSPIYETDVSSIRLLTNTGGTIPTAILSSVREYFSNSSIVLNYGMTETYRSSFLDSELIAQRPDSIGKAIPGVELLVVREDGSIAEAGEQGELVHRGSGTFMGYWGDTASTERALRPDPRLPENSALGTRAVFTGDLAYRDEQGFLYFKGRRDHIIKSMGVRVSPGEIEDLIFSSGLVLDVAIFSLPQEIIGEKVIAAIVPRGDPVTVERALKKYARDTMSPFMQPRAYLRLDSMPKTTSGKKDYSRLKSLAAATENGPH